MQLCLQNILNAYEQRGHEFLVETFESSSNLEAISGIDKLMNAVDQFDDCEMPIDFAELSDDD